MASNGVPSFGGGAGKCQRKRRPGAEVMFGIRDELRVGAFPQHTHIFCRSIDIGHVSGHQVRPLERIDILDALVHVIHDLLERCIIHVDPVTRVAAGEAVVFGGGGVEVAVFLVLGQVRQRAADVHVVLDEIPEGARRLNVGTGAQQRAEIDHDVAVAMGEVKHVQRHALTVRGRGDVGIKLVERRGEFTDGAVLFVFTVVFVVEDRDQASAAVEFPYRASGGFYPEVGEVLDDE